MDIIDTQPSVEDILKLKELKDNINMLYDEMDLLTSDLVENHGFGRFDYDLESVLDNDDSGHYDESLMKDGRYLKVVFTDNMAALKSGGVWKSVKFTKTSTEIRALKRCPESLK